jgi:glycosyltransferase involved in cell wall biosynthesis
MKIALIIHELLVEGGGERQCVCLARALANRGSDVTLWTSAYDRLNCFPEICRSFRVEEVGRGRWPQIQRPRFIRGYLDMLHLASAVEERNQVWNPHHWPAQWAAVWLKRKLGGSTLWMCNDVPDFHHRFNKPELTGLLSACVHGLFYLYDSRLNREIDLTMILSNWAEAEFKKLYFGPTRVVRSGMDPTFFAPGGKRSSIRARFNYSDDEFVLLWLGIFMPHRRLEDAIRAVSSVASRGERVRLLLAGSDRSYPQYLDSLKSLVHTLGAQKVVTFAGKVADKEIRDFYSACDAFVFPNDQQTWGLAVLEAMACGCPVLVSQGAGVHEVLTDQVNAFLFPPRDPETLAEKIKVLVSESGRRREIAEKGMKLVRETYTWGGFARQVETICDEITDRNDSRLLWPVDPEPSTSSRS